jgi:hypothetical protein
MSETSARHPPHNPFDIEVTRRRICRTTLFHPPRLVDEPSEFRPEAAGVAPAGQRGAAARRARIVERLDSGTT